MVVLWHSGQYKKLGKTSLETLIKKNKDFYEKFFFKPKVYLVLAARFFYI